MTQQATPETELPGPPIRRQSFLNLVAGTAGSNVAMALLGSVGGILLARGLGPAQRGDLAIIVVWPTVVGTMATIGLPQAITYWLARRPPKSRQFLSTATLGLVVLGVLVAAGGFALAPFISSSPSVEDAFRIVFLLTPIVFASTGWTSALQATTPFRWNMARLSQSVVYFVAVALLLAADRLSFQSAVVAFVLSLLTQAVVAGLYSRLTIGRAVRPESELFRPLFSYGVRSIASSAPYLVNARLDQLVLSIAVTSTALGNYAVAVSLSFLAAPVSLAFGSIAFPRIAASTSEEEATRVQRSAIIGCTLTACAVLVPLGFLAPRLLPLLFGHGYDDAIVPFRLLIPGTIAFVNNQVIGDVLKGRGRPLVVAVAEGVGAAVTVAGLILLIPRYGINGAAAASTVAYISVTLVLIWALRNTRPLR
ncbi:MAG TPA: oligosaccharide flippase family protein [Acidimicrobiales bacterium]|nr:oligosaccharide flippase family protein [Acidimicrobiales bacterium]